jgi:ADP-ribose pyrophosphatase YjhB (NUDIX family)
VTDSAPVPAPRDADWVQWVRRLAAIAQTGLHFAETTYEQDRYAELAGLAAQMMAALSDSHPAALLTLLGSDDGYATPKVDVRAAVHDDLGRVLLVRERVDGGWTLPGGWADVGESVREGIEREVREESGLLVRSRRLLGIYERDRWGHPPLPFAIYKVVVACDVIGGEPAASTAETDGAGFFPPDDPPPLSLGRTSAALLARVFAHYTAPTLPTDFD